MTGEGSAYLLIAPTLFEWNDSMKKRFILIEGIPGSGKSTFARFLSNQFQRNGHSCRLYLETTFDHPIIETSVNEEPSIFMESYPSRWIDFLNALPQEDIIVIEAAFLQNPIVQLLHKEADRDLIHAVIKKVGHLLSEQDSTLIYFYQKDTQAAIQNMIEGRGGQDYLLQLHEKYGQEPYFLIRHEQGTDSYLSLFQEYSMIANEIVLQGLIPTERIENSAAEYGLYQKQILDKLGLKPIPDPVLETSLLKKYEGVYHNKEMDLELSIVLLDNHLWIFGNKRMNPNREDQFYLDDMSVIISFMMNHSKVEGLVITEKDLYANRNDGGTVFERIS